MPSITLTAPDGKSVTLTPPAGATADDIQATVNAYIDQLHASQPAITAPLPSAPSSPSPLALNAGGVTTQDVADSIALVPPMERPGASVAPLLLRAGGAIAGAASPIPGGAFLGAGAGGAAAQFLENVQGTRDGFNPGRLLVDTVAGGLPGSVAAEGASLPAQLAMRAGTGAVTGAGLGAVTNVSEGQPWDATLGRDAAIGGAMGMAFTLAPEAMRLTRSAWKRARAFVKENPPPFATVTEEVAAKVADSPPVEPQPTVAPGTVVQPEAPPTGQPTTQPAAATPTPSNPTASRAMPPPAPDAPESEFRQHQTYTKVPGLASAMGEVPPAGAENVERIGRALKSVDVLYADRPPTARLAMQDIVVNNADAIQEYARGTQSWERTRALAKEIFPNLDELPPRGTTANAEQMWSLLDTIGALENKASGLAAKIAAGQNDDATKLALKTAQQELVTATLAKVGQAAEIGRSLNVLKGFRNADLTKDPTFIKKANQLGASADEIAAMLAKTDPEDVVGRFRMLRDAQKPGAREYLKWYWLTNVLSGPRTHASNILGNAMNVTYKGLSTPFAATGDWARVQFKGGPREVYVGEVPHQIQGALAGMHEGFRKGLYMFRNGFTPDDITNLEVGPPEVKGGLATNFVSRALGGADAFFKSVGYNMELRAGAYAMAKRQLVAKGVTGAALRAQLPVEMDALVHDPPLALVKQASRFADRATFQEAPGKVTRGFMQIREGLKLKVGKVEIAPMDFVQPFLKTPGNIAKQGFQASPVGFFTQESRVPGRVGVQAKGEAIMGSALLAIPAYLSATGRMSGSGPKEPDKRDALYATGWRPNSIKMPLPDAVVDKLGITRSPEGEYWVNYSLVQPVAVPWSAVANGFEAWAETHAAGTPVPATKVASMILAKTANTMFQQSYLRGTQAALDALSDPERWGETFVQGIAQGFIPLSGALGTVAQVQDPVMREAQGVAQGLSKRIPKSLGPITREMTDGVLTSSDQLPPALRATGEPVVNQTNPLVVPQISPVVRDPLREELGRLDLDLTPPKREATIKVGKRAFPLTQEQDHAIRQGMGLAVRAQIQRVLTSPDYGKLPDEIRRNRLNYVINQTRSMVRLKAKAALNKGWPLTVEWLSGAPISGDVAAVQ